MIKPTPIKAVRYAQSYLFRNKIYIGSLWAALSLEVDKKIGLAGSSVDIDLNLSINNWSKFEEITQSKEFKEYVVSLNRPQPKKKKRR